jgi:hypothetical protein
MAERDFTAREDRFLGLFLATLAIIYLSACASDPAAESFPPSAEISAGDPALIPTVRAEREAATKTYMLCLDRAARRLDDRKSDPAKIARGMLSACGAEFDENVNVRSRYLEDPEARQKVAGTLRESSLDGAIQLVLMNRQAPRSR